MASIASGDGPNGFSFDASLIMGTPDSCCACRMGLPGTYPARALICSGICARTVFFITNERTTEVCITISVAVLGTGTKQSSKGFRIDDGVLFWHCQAYSSLGASFDLKSLPPVRGLICVRLQPHAVRVRAIRLAQHQG